jgi:hypothetical protein
MAVWGPFKPTSWNQELAGLGFLNENHLRPWEPVVPQARNFRENCFLKKFCGIMPHTQRLGFEAMGEVEICRRSRGLACRFEAGVG